MKVQAEISIYPLHIQSLSQPIEEFCEILRSKGLQTKTTAMSTLVTGESRGLFDACDKAFEHLAAKYKLVLNMKVSNACPLDERT